MQKGCGGLRSPSESEPRPYVAFCKSRRRGNKIFTVVMPGDDHQPPMDKINCVPKSLFPKFRDGEDRIRNTNVRIGLLRVKTAALLRRETCVVLRANSPTCLA